MSQRVRDHARPAERQEEGQAMRHSGRSPSRHGHAAGDLFNSIHGTVCAGNRGAALH